MKGLEYMNAPVVPSNARRYGGWEIQEKGTALCPVIGGFVWLCQGLNPWILGAFLLFLQKLIQKLGGTAAELSAGALLVILGASFLRCGIGGGGDAI